MKLSESEMVEGFRQFAEYGNNAEVLRAAKEGLFGRLASLYIGQGNLTATMEMLMTLEGRARACLAGIQNLRQMVGGLEE